MIPFAGVLAGTLLLRALGAAGAGPWRSWRLALLPPLALMFVLTGAAAFTPIGDDLARFLPSGVPHPRLVVALSGVIQLAGGLALFPARSRAVAAGVLIALLLVKLPLNWLGSERGLMVRGPWPTPPLLRVPFVVLWIASLLWLGRAGQRPAGAVAESTPSRR